MTINPKKLFDRAANLIFGVLLLFLTLGIIIGVIHLFLQLGEMVINTDISHSYSRIVSDVLTVFVLIELSRSLVSHFDEHRLRLTFIAEAGIVFVLREIMIKLFEHKISSDEIYALSALLFVLGALRTASALIFQREKRLQSKKRMQRMRQPPPDSINKAAAPIPDRTR